MSLQVVLRCRSIGPSTLHPTQQQKSDPPKEKWVFGRKLVWRLRKQHFLMNTQQHLLWEELRKIETSNNDRRRERDTAVQSSAAIPKCRIRLTDGAALQVSGVGLRLRDMWPLVYRVTATVQTAAEMKEQRFFFSGAGFPRRRNDWRQRLSWNEWLLILDNEKDANLAMKKASWLLWRHVSVFY